MAHLTRDVATVDSTQPLNGKTLLVRLALFALALGAFAIGTTEFVAMGLLPEMAPTFGVSIPTAGWLITAYALGVVVGAPTLTALAHRYSRSASRWLRRSRLGPSWPRAAAPAWWRRPSRRRSTSATRWAPSWADW